MKTRPQSRGGLAQSQCLQRAQVTDNLPSVYQLLFAPHRNDTSSTKLCKLDLVSMCLCAGVAGNDLNMAYERARVNIDDPPSSSVIHKVFFSSTISSLSLSSFISLHIKKQMILMICSSVHFEEECYHAARSVRCDSLHRQCTTLRRSPQ